MKILQINCVYNYGSTGKIIAAIAEEAGKQGHEVLCAVPVTASNRWERPDNRVYRIGSYYGRYFSKLLAQITGLEGCFAVMATWKLIRKMDQFSPDVIHLHNIHDSYLNISMLFRYIKKRRIHTVWTLHDCWAVTGHCPHFDMAGCDKWKTGCHNCSQYRKYPRSYVDNSFYMYRKKRQWFQGVEDMTIITPSFWLAEIVKQSFLKEYPVKVIHNGIDLSVFKPTDSDFRDRYGCGNKYIILGVAFGWGKAKGLDVFLELARRLDERYQIVLVGTDETVENQLSENIIAIRRTQNQQELAGIYTAADVLINPTRQDTYPTVNMEAIACGTPVITFDTGGSPEMIAAGCGAVVKKNNIDALEALLLEVTENKQWKQENCISSSKQYNAQLRYKEIVKLYDKEKNSTL